MGPTNTECKGNNGDQLDIWPYIGQPSRGGPLCSKGEPDVCEAPVLPLAFRMRGRQHRAPTAGRCERV